jgi:hypothetical protein
MDLEGANVLGKKKIWKYSRVTMIMSCGVCPNGRQGEALQKEVIDPNKRFRTKKRNIPIQPNPAFFHPASSSLFWSSLSSSKTEERHTPPARHPAAL